MKTYRVKVTSGNYKGRFIGPNIGRGLVTNPALLETPQVPLSGTDFSLYAQEDAANRFFPEKAAEVQKQLTSLGLTCELVPVD